MARGRMFSPRRLPPTRSDVLYFNLVFSFMISSTGIYGRREPDNGQNTHNSATLRSGERNEGDIAAARCRPDVKSSVVDYCQEGNISD